MKDSIKVLFREYLEAILAALFLAWFIRVFVLNILYIPTENMKPGLESGDFVMGWRLAYGFPVPLTKGQRLNPKQPQPGDVVALRFPGDEEQMIVRRVVGLPGDRIKIHQGVVWVNGKALSQEERAGGQVWEKRPGAATKASYPIVPNPGADMGEVKVPAQKLFVLADNRLGSDDSRDWGFVPIQNVESELVLIWFSMETGDFQVRWSRLFNSIQ